MNLHPSDEETQLQDTMRRFAQDRAGVDIGDPHARYEAGWRAFAALGGAGMAIAEERGGFGVSPEGLALAAFELGAMPIPAPRIEQVVAVARLLEAVEGGEAAAALRDAFVAGDSHVVLADWEGAGPHGFAPAKTRADGHGAHARLSGSKAAVIGGDRADVALVTAWRGADPALFAVRLDRLDRRAHLLADRTPVADLRLDGLTVEGPPLLAGPTLMAALERARDEAIVAAAAASSGSMVAAIRLTVDYLKIRRQFGTALADFQALQQRVADLYILANEARSSVYAALAALHGAPAARRRAVSGCKLKVARAARHVTGEAVHLHGGIGFTAEYAVGHHHLRALVDAALLGDADVHLARYLREPEAEATGADTPIEALAPIVATV